MRITKVSCVVAAMVVAMAAGAASAVSVTVPNYSFENGSGTNPQDEGAGWWTDSMLNGGFNSNDILSDWDLQIQTYRFGGRWNPRDDHYAGASDVPTGDEPAEMDGPQVAFLHWGAGAGTGTSYITSTNAVTTIEEGTYTLTVSVGDPTGTAMDAVVWANVAILANGASVASYLAAPPADGTWTEFTAVLDNTLGTYTGQDLKIQLSGRITGTMEKRHVDFDNVRLDFEGETPPEFHPGDANGDGVIDLQDFGILKDKFGTTSGAVWADGDFNEDGLVDLQDFGILKDHFGHTAGDPLAAIPEPATLGLLAVGAVVGLRRRSRQA